MTNIFIANLDWEISSEDLLTTFSSFGKVNYAHVVFDQKTKKSKGFGYVEMDDTDAAINAIQALNGMDINGRKLDVKIASPKGNRPKKEAKSESSSENKPFKPGGFQKRDGGFQKREGGFQKREGGYQKREGGYQNREGGYQKREGGFQKRDGESGGYRKPAGDRPYTPRPDGEREPFKKDEE